MAQESVFVERFYVNILRVLFEIFRNFVSTVTKPDYSDHIDKVWKKSDNLHRSCKMFGANMYFTEIAKVSKTTNYLLYQ